jgi:hypothetical protein
MLAASLLEEVFNKAASRGSETQSSNKAGCELVIAKDVEGACKICSGQCTNQCHWLSKFFDQASLMVLAFSSKKLED